MNNPIDNVLIFIAHNPNCGNVRLNLTLPPEIVLYLVKFDFYNLTKKDNPMKKTKFKMQRFIFLAVIFVFVFTCQCMAKTHLELANEYAAQSEKFFKAAVCEYDLALKEPGADKLKINFLLGKLYYEHGRFEEAIQILASVYAKKDQDFAIAKLLALSYFKNGDWTDALSIFDKNKDSEDEEFLYFYGKTCEKQNLFDQAVKIYGKIKGIKYKKFAEERVTYITAKTRVATVKDIADSYIKNLIETSPGQSEYTNAGAIILLSDENFKILNDYTSVQEHHSLIKILNDRGKEKYGEVKLSYDSTYEKIEVVYARTIKLDGTIISVGAKHIRDISEYPEYPLYSNARLKIISMPGLTQGAIIEYKAKKYIKKLINGRELCENYSIQSFEPCLNKRISLTVPPEYEISFKSYNPGYLNYELNFSPSVEKLKNGSKYTWEFKDIPEIIAEPSMPPYAEITPYFCLSSFSNWSHIYKWWEKLYKEKIRTNEAIEEKTQELIKGKSTEKDKARAIYNWCAAKIRYVGVEYGEAGFEPHYATEIFKNKYGDCKDQTMLLISMLKFAGISAYPVLIGTRGIYPLDEGFPTLLFNHAICLTKIGKELIFLDPTGETTSFGDLPGGDQNREVLVFYEKEGKIEKIPLFGAEHNKVFRKLTISVNPDESISGTMKIDTFGIYNQGQRWWLKYTKPVLTKEELKSWVSTISPGGELQNYQISDVEDLDQPVEIKMEFKGPKFLAEAGKNRLVPLLGGVSATLVSREKRNYPLDFDILSSSYMSVEIKLPQNLAVDYLPQPITEDTPWFSYFSEYTFSKGTICFEEGLIRKKILVSTKSYREYKEIYEELARQTDKQIVLKKVSEE